MATRILEALRPTRSTLARLVVTAGGGLLSLGIALIYPPAGVIAGGLALIALGLFVLPVPPPPKQ